MDKATRARWNHIWAGYELTAKQRDVATELAWKRLPNHPRDSYQYIPLTSRISTAMIDLGIDVFTQTRGRPPKTFLELGCGFGVVTHWVNTQRGLDATGVDICPVYVNESKKHLKGKFFVRNVLRMRSLDQYDIVYFYQPFADYRAANRFCARVARLCKRNVICPLYMLSGELDLPTHRRKLRKSTPHDYYDHVDVVDRLSKPKLIVDSFGFKLSEPVLM